MAALFTVLLGLPTGVLLFVSRRNGLAPMPKLNAVLGAIINFGRSLPFIVLLIALIVHRLIIGTTLGSTAAVVPVTIGAFPFFARLTENALDEVDYGRIEAILSMGGNIWHVIFKSLLPEALPTLLAGITLTIVMLIGFSSMAGVIGGGGLGDLAIRYGYQRFNNEVMFGTVLILVALVQGVQMAGDRLVAASPTVVNNKRMAARHPRLKLRFRAPWCVSAPLPAARESGSPLPGPVRTVLTISLRFRRRCQRLPGVVSHGISRNQRRIVYFTPTVNQTSRRASGNG